MPLDSACRRLDWPSPQQVFAPSGAGPKVLASLAEAKIGQAVRRLPGGANARVGVLMGNANADATEAPVAVVCEFATSVPADTLWETHRLSWNFCRSPLLITLEANLIRAWTCCESPTTFPPSALFGVHDLTQQVEQCDLDQLPAGAVSEHLAQSLHWVHLVSGNFLRRHPERFQRNQRADDTLLANLDFVREELKGRNLDSDIAHDLLARIIFIQFLSQRKDSAGVPALNERILKQLHNDSVLSAVYTKFSEILLNYKDAYNLFQWLNSKFNGDLFPGSGKTEEAQEAEWRTEMAVVKATHLKVLSQFVDGTLMMAGGQYSLWPLYSFDAIPLEFISSIYEMFVDRDRRKKGIYYTPGHLVDVVLDEVLPWESKEWDIRILDPACGSGIFLVKAFQRLVYRWKVANSDQEPKAPILRQILENNLLGIDLDPHAVRVASFSLYLAMCDEIDPKHYWKQVRFPRLRNTRIISADFFQEDVSGIQSEGDQERYDLIIGNAPWGKDTITDAARRWGKQYEWPPVNEGVGTLFLPKALMLTKKGGRVRMIQPAGSLLFNSIPTALAFRNKLLKTFAIEEIINLSALRFVLFTTAISPACIITIRPTPPSGLPIQYISPKSQQNSEDGYRIVVDPNDVHQLLPSEAIAEPSIWCSMMWGGGRDVALIQRLSKRTNFKKLREKGAAHIRRGVSWGDRKGNQSSIVGLRMLNDAAMDSSFLTLKASSLPINSDPHAHSCDSTDMDAFELPQMLIKHSWSQQTGRFKAVVVSSDQKTGPVFCTRSYTSIHVKSESKHWLDVACLVYNSRLPVYYLLLTSGRFASYRPEPTEAELLSVPLPEPLHIRLEGLGDLAMIDAQVEKMLELKPTEQALVDDMFDVTLRDFKGDDGSPGRQSTRLLSDSKPDGDRIMTAYCTCFMQILSTGFAERVLPRATIFREQSAEPLPLRVVAFHFDNIEAEPVSFEAIESVGLLELLSKLNEVFLTKSGKDSGGIFYQRIVHVYSPMKIGNRIVPTVYLIKPDQVRYWTRSAAMRDADQVASDMWDSDQYVSSNLPNSIKEKGKPQ
jgi:hypothetical protein